LLAGDEHTLIAAAVAAAAVVHPPAERLHSCSRWRGKNLYAPLTAVAVFKTAAEPHNWRSS